MKNKFFYLIFLIVTTVSYVQTNKLDQIKVFQAENTIENTEKLEMYFDLANSTINLR